MLSGRVEPVLALVVRRRDFLEDVRLSKKWQGADPQEALKRGRLQLALLPLERRRGPYPRPLSKTISHSKHYRLQWEGAPSGGLAVLVSGGLEAAELEAEVPQRVQQALARSDSARREQGQAPNGGALPL